jgi:hypothetical protein
MFTIKNKTHGHKQYNKEMEARKNNKSISKAMD